MIDLYHELDMIALVRAMKDI